MHETGPYSFHGDAPIAGLLPFEMDVLRLGHAVHTEQQTDDGGPGGADPLRQRKRELERGQKQARDEMLDDLGFQ